MNSTAAENSTSESGSNGNMPMTGEHGDEKWVSSNGDSAMN